MKSDSKIENKPFQATGKKRDGETLGEKQFKKVKLDVLEEKRAFLSMLQLVYVQYNHLLGS